MNTRRSSVSLLGGAARWPLAARAQPNSKIFRVGYLSSYSAESGKPLLACFQDGLRQLGWVEGLNVHFDYRWSGGAATPLPTLAEDLVRTNPDVIVELIWDVVTQIKVGERGHAYVVDAQGRLIAHPDISLVLRNTDRCGFLRFRM